MDILRGSSNFDIGSRKLEDEEKRMKRRCIVTGMPKLKFSFNREDIRGMIYGLQGMM